MSVQLQVSEGIDRPVARVFHFYAHEQVRNHPRWNPDMQLEQVSDGPIGVGTIIRRRHTHTGTPVEGMMKVVEFEPERAFGVVIHDGPTETFGRATFEFDGALEISSNLSNLRSRNGVLWHHRIDWIVVTLLVSNKELGHCLSKKGENHVSKSSGIGGY